MTTHHGTDDLSPDSRIQALERENAKLRKINQVLMDRVERSMDFQGNAFSLFHTATVLESKVRERTTALESVLRELESTNTALHLVKEEEERAKLFLSEAIESISEGFVLCDADDCLVLTNSKYREMWPGLPGDLTPGLPFAEILRRAVISGMVIDSGGDPEVWLNRRMESHRDPHEPFVLQFRDGQWLQVSERRLRDGGIVGLYTDITEIKVREKRRRERELAQKSILLQATLDNLSQGVSVFDADNRLVAWNDRFIELLGVPRHSVWPGTPLARFMALPPLQTQFSLDHDGTPHPLNGDRPLWVEHECPNGQVMEIHRNRMPDGGFVTTYTDITERKRAEEALRDSERRIRLITDAIPALIAYVDGNECFRFTNKGYEDWFGLPRSEINGRPMWEVLGSDLYHLRRDAVRDALAGRQCTFEMTLPRADPKGGQKVQYVLASYVPHVASDGQVLGFFALIQDITESRLAAEQLQDAKQSLERRVEERTTELRRANDEMTAAKAEAETANLSKTKFLAAASHDLLQPLAAARVFISALSERRLAPANRALVQSSVSALDSVDELLTALLDISKLDAGVLQTEIKDFLGSDLVCSLVDEYAMMARAKGLVLRRVPSSLPVRTDPRLLSRVLRNLLSNAIRYTDTGRVLVGCKRRGNHLLIGVWDTGIGIPSDKLEEIFDEFHRLNEGQQMRGEKGMGLGLAIVRRITRMLDMRIEVHSVPGRGSCFLVEVPLGENPVPASIAPAAQVQRRVGTLAGTKVLMIDNDPSILAGVQALLGGWSCTTWPARSGAEALDIVRAEGRPDIIIADYHLDDGEIGLDAVAGVLGVLEQPVPVIVVTANHSADLQAEVATLGYHLQNKPLKPAHLRSLMVHLLR
ncbi:MAG: hypothetical protein VR70_06075 [Rhodospirillaceae bacterium BRH_c57]|nr:MAG: hypothetical protein VR70_06075 [Rhodospirillaceae bacterium BRH_c57]